MKYKIILKKLSYLFLSFALVISTVACDQVESVPDGSGLVVEEAVGGWWVIALKSDGVTPAYGGDYVKFNTYNSAANDLTFWLDDNGNYMEIKAKATINMESLTFSSEVNTPEITDPEKDITVTITNGIITKNSYTTESSNTTVDEIMFEAEFSWDPGIVYIFKGHKNTGIVGDQNPHF